jgi:hypothetical protein
MADRMIAQGQIPNVGRKNAPGIRRADLPRKPMALRSPEPGSHIHGAERLQIARSIVEPTKGAR